MATLNPSLDDLRHSSATDGERLVAEILQRNLGDDCLIWFSPKIPPSNLEPDFVVLDPGKGLLVLEVKDWKIETVVEANNDLATLLVDNEQKGTTNPYKQCKAYGYNIVNKLDKENNLKYPNGHRHQGRLVIPYGIGVILTRITRSELRSRNLEAVFGSNSVFCKDEIFKNIDAELFQDRLWRILPFPLSERLDSGQVDSFCQVLHFPNKFKEIDSEIIKVSLSDNDKKLLEVKTLETPVVVKPPVIKKGKKTTSDSEDINSVIDSSNSTGKKTTSDSEDINSVIDSSNPTQLKSSDAQKTPVSIGTPLSGGKMEKTFVYSTHKPISKPWWQNKLYIFVGGCVATFTLLIAAILIKDSVAPVMPASPESRQSSNSVLQTKSITIGGLKNDGNYKGLADYLQKTLGSQIKIKIDSGENVPYQEAKNHLAKKEWDITFTQSPMLSVAAKDNNYIWFGRMFPDKDPFYQAALFVRSDSKIQSIVDIKTTTSIALADFNSASSFYMPSYDLFGKRLNVKMGHRSPEIVEMVKSGKADIGAAAYSDVIKKEHSLRVIQLSRNIPGSGVYLSPSLSESDRKIISKALIDAPKEIKQKANYVESPEIDYSIFSGIVSRVEKILSCSDFSKNPVDFYCTDRKGIVGQVNGMSQINQQTTRLSVKGKDGSLYYVLVSPQILNQIPGAGSAIALQNKNIKLLDTTPQKLDDGKLQITIAQPGKMEVLDN